MSLPARAGRGRTLLFWGVFVLALWQLPQRAMRRQAEPWWQGEPDTQQQLGRAVQQALSQRLGETHYATGSARFDGEWLFATYMMAALGFGQLAAEHPELRAEYLPAMDAVLDRLIEPELRAFDTAAWDRDAFASLDGAEAHVALLGYLDLALSLRAWLAPAGRHAALNDRISAALTRRFERASEHLLETYPGEIYPVDNASAIGAIALHARANGRPLPPVVGQWIARIRAGVIAPDSGLLRQAVLPSGAEVDEARGSGSALAAYFLSFADADISAQLYGAVHGRLAETVLGFQMVQEYPYERWRLGDVDSGPLVAGYSVSATGFAVAAARANGDRDSYLALASTVHLVGGARSRPGLQRFAAGGSLGDALMLALLTAQPASRWAAPPPREVARLEGRP